MRSGLILKIRFRNTFVIASLIAPVLVFVSLFLCQSLIEDAKYNNPSITKNIIVDFISPPKRTDVKKKTTKPMRVTKGSQTELSQKRQDLLLKGDFLKKAKLETSDFLLPAIKMNGLISGDGSYFPRFKIPPLYPLRARNLGIEGSCLVEYTITTKGNVVDVVEVPGQCKSIFKKSSIDAAKKFLYRPMIVNGSPQKVEKVKNRFIFQLQSDE